MERDGGIGLWIWWVVLESRWVVVRKVYVFWKRILWSWKEVCGRIVNKGEGIIWICGDEVIGRVV